MNAQPFRSRRFATAAVVMLTAWALLPSCKFLFQKMGEAMFHVERWANGTPKREGQLVDGLQSGNWAYNYEDGRRRAQGPYREDRQFGSWVYWYESGNVELEGAYDKVGHRTGSWVYYYDDEGFVKGRGRYLDDAEEGVWQFYDQEGRLARVGGFDRAKRSGFWREYHPDGAVRAEGVYHRGKRIGHWKLVDEDGVVSQRDFGMRSTLAVAIDRWEDGSRRRIGVLDGGSKVGCWTSFHRDGQTLRFVTSFESDDAVRGAFFAMRADGSPCADGVWDDVGGGFSADCRAYPLGESTPIEMVAGPMPQMPAVMDEEFREPGFADTASGEAVAVAWLDELKLPLDTKAVEAPPELAGIDAAPAAGQLAALDEADSRIPAPMQPGWTVLQVQEMADYVKNYQEGKDPKRVSRRRYGVAGESDSQQRGRGRKSGPRRRTELEGKALPVTRFVSVDGTEIDTNELRGKKRVLLVVLRGFAGEVCVYCVAQTKALANCRAQFEDLNLEVLVVYPGPEGNEQAFLQAYEATFGEGAPPYKVFYDPDLSLVSRLGIEGGDLAYPTTLIVDKQGLVEFAYVGEHRADRPAAKKLLEVIRGLEKE